MRKQQLKQIESVHSTGAIWIYFPQVRLGSGNRDFHYTHWSILIDRFDPRDLQGLSTQPKQITAQGPDPTIFFLSSNEHEALRYSFIFSTWLKVAQIQHVSEEKNNKKQLTMLIELQPFCL